MAGGMSYCRGSFNIKKIYEMNEPKEINEMEVEICLELARQFDTEDLTHPPYRHKEEEEEKKEDE